MPLPPPFTSANALDLTALRQPPIAAPSDKTPEPSPEPKPDVIIPGGATADNGLQEFLRKELAVAKINCIHRHLWWAGRPDNIRPLHRQMMMLRSILITESPALHLVWFDSTIYIKPIPEYLLNWEFFNTHICPSDELFELACGFLLSYARLIVHKSDFNIAAEKGLLPPGVSWTAWCSFASDIRNICPTKVNRRYRYGELRLRRLNQIYQFCRWELAYQSVYTQYDNFFSQNFAWLLLLFAYFSLILSAMQVILAAQGATGVLRGVSYWFGVCSVFVVLVAVFVVLGLFVILFIRNMIATLCWQHTFHLRLKRVKSEVGIV